MATEAAPVTAIEIAAHAEKRDSGGTRAGVGFSENARSREAGAEAARQALQRAGLARCDLVVLFSTGKHDPVQLIEGVRSVVGPKARLFGGNADGIITNDRQGYNGHQVGVAVMRSDTVQIDMFIEPGLADREYDVGLALGRQIKAGQYAGEPNLVVLYDAPKKGLNTAGTSLNMGNQLLAGMSAALETWPSTGGGGLTGSMALNPGYQWLDDVVEQGSALALALSGSVRMDTIVMHGCKPSSGYYTISKAEGNVVLELDGRPAADVVGELIGPDIDWRSWPIVVPLGMNTGDRFGEYVDDHYIARACQAVDEARGGLAMFADDLQAGMDVQIMRLSFDPDYMTQRIARLLGQAGDRRPIFALYFDCACREGRVTIMGGAESEQEEAEVVQRALGPHIPLLGMYSCGEVGRSGPQMQVQALNFTGVLCLFSEER